MNLDHVLLKCHIRDKILIRDGQYLVVQIEKKTTGLKWINHHFILFLFDNLTYFFTKNLERCCLLVLILKIGGIESNVYSTNNVITFALCEQIVLSAVNEENVLINERGFLKKRITFFDYEVLDEFINS